MSKVCDEVTNKECSSKGYNCSCDGCSEYDTIRCECEVTKVDTCPLYGCPKYPLLAIEMEEGEVVLNPVSEVSDNDLLAQEYLDACGMYVCGSDGDEFIITNAPKELVDNVLALEVPEDVDGVDVSGWFVGQLNELGYIAIARALPLE